jgi:hypothetical protein
LAESGLRNQVISNFSFVRRYSSDYRSIKELAWITRPPSTIGIGELFLNDMASHTSDEKVGSTWRIRKFIVLDPTYGSASLERVRF